MKKILLLGISLLCIGLNAQIDSTEVEDNTKDILDASYNQPQVYTLANLTIVGDSRYTKNQIARFTGLRGGTKIEIPGPKINAAVRKLWKQNLFSDVEIYVSKIQGDKVFLNVNLIGLPELLEVDILGVKKFRKEDFIKDNKLKPGTKITDNLINQTKNHIIKFYEEKGYPDTKVTHQLKPDPNNARNSNLVFKVNKGPRVKIKDIEFVGNNEIKSKRLRRKGLKNTKRRSLNFLRSSKLIDEKYQEDLQTLIDEYKSIGFRDAKIIKDTIERIDNENFLVKIYIDEGQRYYVGDVTFAGNSVFSSELLQRVFSYDKGDPFDAVGIDKKITGSDKDDDISTLYYNEGYLFASIVPIEKNVKNDTIDLEIRIREGEPATWDRVTFTGNHVTHDHVISRLLQTKPGDLFSKRAIKATVFELAGTNYFEPAAITPNINPKQETNTVDVHWELAPKSSSQIELQGGYGAGRFIGTLGLTFGNFSIGNLLKGKQWRPVPLGDGQTLSLRAQAGQNFSNYSLNFVEPWIGGKRPTALSVSFFYSRFNQQDRFGQDSNLGILGTSVGLNKRLNRPDRYFSLSQSISYRRYNFNNYNISAGNINLDNGSSNNLSYNVTFGRMNAGPDPIFPRSGSEFSVSLDATFPYSLVNSKDYESLRADGNFEEIYKWLEFYKVKARAYWFQEILGKMVARVGGEFGYLGYYNSEVGAIPFERFFLGGTGLQGNRFDGREIIPLRGYEDASNLGGQPNRDITPEGGGTVYNKFLLELRYPITMSQGAKIYALTFLEAGNTWDNNGEFQPFELRRSAGVGIRVFMSAFGLLGFDFGHGFDPALFGVNKSGWQTHFIFGQNL